LKFDTEYGLLFTERRYIVSSKRRIRKRSCEGKIRHTDVNPAHAHARKLGRRYHVYRCQFCGGYHV